jgi:hypothetical protein
MGNASNSWGSPSYAQAASAVDPWPLYLSQSYRYWKILFEDSTNPDGVIKIGEIYLGAYTELASNYARPKWGSGIMRKRRTIDNEAETGRRTQRIWSVQRSFALNFDMLPAADAATLQDVWESTYDLDTGVVTPLWVHYFSDESTYMMLCRILSDFELMFPSYSVYQTGDLTFEEVAKTR